MDLKLLYLIGIEINPYIDNYSGSSQKSEFRSQTEQDNRKI